MTARPFARLSPLARATPPRAIPALSSTSPSCCRPFITFPGGGEPFGSSTQTLSATRTLPYARAPLYDLIADVDAYAGFVPYCSRSRVTQWSAPGEDGRRWPLLAELHVGWGGLHEAFTSRLRCVPGVLVEAVSGGDGDGDEAASAVFRSLTTRWSLEPVAQGPMPSTKVHLVIQYRFANPLYAAISSAVSDKVAATMVDAFEKQARSKLGSHLDP